MPRHTQGKISLTRRRLARFYDRRARRAEQPGPAAVLEQAENNDPDPEWAEEFNNRVLEAALNRIRPQFEQSTWTAFERVWIENRPAAEAADELSIRIHSVYMAKSRVLKRLMEEVRDIAEETS